MKKDWPIESAFLLCTLAFCTLFGILNIHAYLGTLKDGFDPMHCPPGRDFINMWTAAKLALSGHMNTLFDLNAYHAAQRSLFGPNVGPHNWSYPPHIVVPLLPLGLLSYPAALAAWNILTFSLYAFAVCWKRPDGRALALFLLTASASVENFIDGQNGFWVAALLAGGLRLLDKRPVAAGALFGALTMKPQFGLLLPVALLAAKKWKAVLAAAVTAVLMIGLSIALFGVEPWADFLRITIPLQEKILGYAWQPEWLGYRSHPFPYYAAMMPSAFMFLELHGFPRACCMLVAAAFAAGGALAVFRAYRAPLNEDLRAAIFLAAAFIATPYSFVYDMPILSASVISFLCFRRGRMLSPPETALVFGVWVLPSLVVRMGLEASPLPLAPMLLAGYLFYLSRCAEEEITAPA